jgi:hypothetical protein
MSEPEPAPSRPDQPCAILVASCDANSDLWPIFFHFFFHHYPDVSLPIYLLSNFRAYNDPRVETLCSGEDTSWSDGVRYALDHIPCPYVWMLLDDFFLDRPVNDERVNRLISQWVGVGGKYLEPTVTTDGGNPVPGAPLRELNETCAHAGVNSSMYRSTFLREIAQPGENPWQVNSRLASLNYAGEPGMYVLEKNEEPLIRFVEAVKGRFWKPPAVDFLRSQGVEPDLGWRPCPPLEKTFFQKLVRSFHKRRIQYRQDRQQEKDRRNSVVVEPLDPETLTVRTPR